MTENVILQLTDLVTTRRCALRIDQHDLELTLDYMLDKYLKNPDLATLRQERRIADDSEETLTAIQDLVYISSDSGSLTDMFEGVEFLQDGRFLGGRRHTSRRACHHRRKRCPRRRPANRSYRRRIRPKLGRVPPPTMGQALGRLQRLRGGESGGEIRVGKGEADRRPGIDERQGGLHSRTRHTHLGSRLRELLSLYGP